MEEHARPHSHSCPARASLMACRPSAIATSNRSPSASRILMKSPLFHPVPSPSAIVKSLHTRQDQAVAMLGMPWLMGLASGRTEYMDCTSLRPRGRPRAAAAARHPRQAIALPRRSSAISRHPRPGSRCLARYIWRAWERSNGRGMVISVPWPLSTPWECRRAGRAPAHGQASRPEWPTKPFRTHEAKLTCAATDAHGMPARRGPSLDRRRLRGRPDRLPDHRYASKIRNVWGRGPQRWEPFLWRTETPRGWLLLMRAPSEARSWLHLLKPRLSLSARPDLAARVQRGTVHNTYTEGTSRVLRPHHLLCVSGRPIMG